MLKFRSSYFSFPALSLHRTCSIVLTIFLWLQSSIPVFFHRTPEMEHIAGELPCCRSRNSVCLDCPLLVTRFRFPNFGAQRDNHLHYRIVFQALVVLSLLTPLGPAAPPPPASSQLCFLVITVSCFVLKFFLLASLTNPFLTFLFFFSCLCLFPMT